MRALKITLECKACGMLKQTILPAATPKMLKANLTGFNIKCGCGSTIEHILKFETTNLEEQGEEQ